MFCLKLVRRAALPALFVCAPAFAQSVATATITGNVANASNQPVRAAVISLRSNGGILREAQSDSGGRFTLSEVPVGMAHLEVRVNGQTTLDKDVDIVAGIALSLNLGQDNSAGSVQTSVAAVSEHVDVTATADKRPSEITNQPVGLPALSSVVTHEEIEHTNVFRDFGEVLNRIPGITIASLPQGDIGTGIKLRGFFTRSHGADIAVYIDGAPQNVPASTIGGTGFNDMTWLLPALIDRVEVIKGPFSALYGDQNRAGAIRITTRETAESRATITVGRFNTVDANVVLSKQLGRFSSLVAADFMRSSGYRTSSGFEHGTLFAKETFRAGGGVWSARGYYQGSNWDAAGFLFLSALQAGTVQATSRDTTSPPLFGDANRTNFTLTRRPESGERGLELTAYAERYNRRRATGANATTVNVQSDTRWISGGRVLRTFNLKDRASLIIGGELRSDYGTGIIRQQANNVFTATYLQDQNLNMLQYAGLTQGQFKLLRSLKLVGGLRVDAFHYNFANQKIPAASTVYDKPVATPKIGLVYSPVERVSAFFNMGQGFRSSDQSEISPSGSAGPLGAAGGNAVTSISPPKVTSYDYGFNTRLNPRWTASGAGFYTLNQSETVSTGPYTFVAAGDSTRLGWEAETNFQVSNSLNVYASLTDVVKARLNNPANNISNQLNVPQYVPKAGFGYLRSVRKGNVALNLDGFYYSPFPYYSGTPLTLKKTKPYARYDLRGSYYVGRVELTGFARLAPYKYSGEAMFSSAAGLSVDPEPHWYGGFTGRYRF